VNLPSPGFDLRLFVSTFVLIAVAELPDKTAFATLLLATRKNPYALFIGVALAFVVQSVIAVCFGSLFGLLPESIVRIGSGVVFLFFAVSMWLRKHDEHEEEDLKKGESVEFWKTVGTSFVVIFIAEWGDLTQLATAALEAKFRNPVTILSAAILALWLVTAIAIAVGYHAKKMIDPAKLQKVAAVAFALVGVVFLVKAFA
jgi:putative Ca2+/H+ antiporter (TMEM165/GDT1 family)